MFSLASSASTSVQTLAWRPRWPPVTPPPCAPKLLATPSRRCALAPFNGILIHCEASRPELVRKLLLDLVWRHGASRFWALEQLLIKPHLGRCGDKAQARPGKQDSGYSMSSQRFIQSRILRRCKASSEHWGALSIRKGLNE